MSIVKSLKRSNSIANIDNKFVVLPTNLIDRNKIKCYQKNDVNITTKSLLECILDLQNLNPSLLLNKSSVNNIESTFQLTQRTSDNLFVKDSIKNTNTFEQYTAIDQERPNIICYTDMAQLYTNDGELTNVGKFFFFKLRYKLSYLNSVNDLINEFKSLDPFLSSKNAYVDLTTQLKTISDFFIKSSSVIRTLKDSFDVRDSVYDLYINDYLEYFNDLNFDDIESKELETFIKNNIRKTTSIVDVLINDFHYDDSNVKLSFSSSKTILQFLSVYKELLMNYSNSLLMNSSIDHLSMNSDRKISIEKNLPNMKQILAHKNITSIDSIVNVNSSLNIDFQSMFTTLTKGFDEFNKDLANVDKIIYLTNTFSKIIRYSNGLNKSVVKNELSKTFNYQVSNTNNDNVFDAIFGNDQDDVYTTTGVSNGINSILYELQANESALNFESRKNNVSGFLSAPEYYIDDFFGKLKITNSVIYQSTRLSTLSKKLSTYQHSIDTIAKEMNWLCLYATDNFQVKTAGFERIISVPTKCFEFLHDSFVNTRSKTLLDLYKNDKMVALIDAAASNNELKTALFLFCLDFIKNNQNYWTVTSKIKLSIRDVIDKIVFSQNIKTRVDGSFISATEYIENAKKLGFFTTTTFNVTLSHSPTLEAISKLLIDVYESLNENNQVFSSSKTRYLSTSDTIVMMMLFDIIVSIISKYSTYYLNGMIGVSFDTPKNSSNRDVLFVSISTKESTTDLSNVKNKLDLERQMLINSYISLSNTLKTLQSKVQQFINFFDTNKSIMNLFVSLLPQHLKEDGKYIQYAFTEQQLMLRAFKISELITYSKLENNHIYDTLTTSNKQIEFLSTLFKTKYFANNSKKTIISVGIPTSISEQINNKFFNKKLQIVNQNDIIKISVSKVDNLNPDIIYKPINFLFEMSRIPVRNGELLPNDINQIKNLDDLTMIFPTRDVTTMLLDRICIGDPTKIKNYFSNKDLHIVYAFFSNDYATVGNNSKIELLRNHMISYAAELYLSTLNDFEVNEMKLCKDVSDIDFSFSTATIITYVKTLILNILIENGIIEQRQISSISQLQLQQLIDLIPNHILDVVLRKLSMLHYALNVNTTLCGNDKINIANSTFATNLFDRVFNVVVDENDFLVDVDEMSKTLDGRNTLQTYINNGTIIETQKNKPFIDIKKSYDNKQYYVKNNVNAALIDTFTVDVQQWDGEE